MCNFYSKISADKIFLPKSKDNERRKSWPIIWLAVNEVLKSKAE